MGLLAIDPGLNTGWAIFEAGRLVACGLHTDAKPTLPPRADFVVIERPQVYAARLSKGDPNDLITLAIRVGRYWEKYVSLGARVGAVLPNEWKGQVPKQIHHKRILGALTPAESAIAATAKTHDVLDAVGLGQWAVKTQFFSRG